MAVFTEFVLATHGFFVMANVSSFGMGAYFFVVTATEDIKINVIKFNECTTVKRNQPKAAGIQSKAKKLPGKNKTNYSKNQKNQMKLLKFLSNFIRLHAKIVKLSIQLFNKLKALTQ